MIDDNGDFEDDDLYTYEEYMESFRKQEAEFLECATPQQRDIWYAYRHGVLEHHEAIRLIKAYATRDMVKDLTIGYKKWLTDNTERILNRVTLKEYTEVLK